MEALAQEMAPRFETAMQPIVEDAIMYFLPYVRVPVTQPPQLPSPPGCRRPSHDAFMQRDSDPDSDTCPTHGPESSRASVSEGVSRVPQVPAGNAHCSPTTPGEKLLQTAETFEDVFDSDEKAATASVAKGSASPQLNGSSGLQETGDEMHSMWLTFADPALEALFKLHRAASALKVDLGFCIFGMVVAVLWQDPVMKDSLAGVAIGLLLTSHMAAIICLPAWVWLPYLDSSLASPEVLYAAYSRDLYTLPLLHAVVALGQTIRFKTALLRGMGSWLVGLPREIGLARRASGIGLLQAMGLSAIPSLAVLSLVLLVMRSWELAQRSKFLSNLRSQTRSGSM
eukprot:jgi/Botrbrau1/13149/Bobra.0187s0097.1